jgi:hypothetical protein
MMTPLIRRLHKLAKRHHLPNALGRALVLANRHYNDGGRGWDEDEVAFMRRVQPETARRWLLHWSRGGSLKALRYSRKRFLNLRRQYRRDQVRRMS